MVCSATANRSSNSSTVNTKIYLVTSKSTAIGEDANGYISYLQGTSYAPDIKFTIDSKTYAAGEHLIFETDIEIGHSTSTGFLNGEGWFEGWVYLRKLWDITDEEDEDYEDAGKANCGTGRHYKTDDPSDGRYVPGLYQ